MTKKKIMYQRIYSPKNVKEICKQFFVIVRIKVILGGGGGGGRRGGGVGEGLS